jgi:hypothetical protein
LPHSEIVGSKPASGSPTLIAALPRPSSARSAEASTIRSYCLRCGTSVRENGREGIENETWIVKEQAGRQATRSGPSPLNRDDDRAGRLGVGVGHD